MEAVSAQEFLAGRQCCRQERFRACFRLPVEPKRRLDQLLEFLQIVLEVERFGHDLDQTE